MFMTKPTTLTLTLFFYVTLIFALAVPSEVKGFQHIRRHDHANPVRFIRKRSPLPQDTAIPLVHLDHPAEATPTSAAPAPSTTTTTPTSSAPETSQPASTPASSSSSTSPPPPQTKSTPPSRPTTTPAQEQKPTAAPPPEQPIAAPPPPPTPVEAVKPTVTKTQSIDSASTSTSTEEPVPQTNPTKTKASNPLSVMVMVGASIAGSAILWTVFRKWKLRRSKRFDARLRPITFP